MPKCWQMSQKPCQTYVLFIVLQFFFWKRWGRSLVRVGHKGLLHSPGYATLMITSRRGICLAFAQVWQCALQRAALYTACLCLQVSGRVPNILQSDRSYCQELFALAVKVPVRTSRQRQCDSHCPLQVSCPFPWTPFSGRQHPHLHQEHATALYHLRICLVFAGCWLSGNLIPGPHTLESDTLTTETSVLQINISDMYI